MEDLQSLVRRRLRHLSNRHQFTAVHACRRATEAGYPIPLSLFSQIQRRPIGERWGPPKTPTLLGLAIGLDLPRAEVGDAAWRSAGYPTPIRMYPKAEVTESTLCTCEPTHSRVYEELVVMIPQPGLTNAEISHIANLFEEIVTRQCELLAHSEQPTHFPEAR